MPNTTPEPIAAWLCRECDTAHESLDEANDCCKPSIAEGYLCPICRSYHETSDAAAACCYEFVEQGDVGEIDFLRFTMAARSARESAGQRTLF